MGERGGFASQPNQLLNRIFPIKMFRLCYSFCYELGVRGGADCSAIGPVAHGTWYLSVFAYDILQAVQLYLLIHVKCIILYIIFFWQPLIL